jgi:hypothetical protein
MTSKLYKKSRFRIVILITTAGDGSYCGPADGCGRIFSNEERMSNKQGEQRCWVQNRNIH